VAFLRRRTSIANSRSQNAADRPYKPRNHGVFKPFGALGVTYGYGTREELVRAQADRIVDSPLAIPDVIEAWKARPG